MGVSCAGLGRHTCRHTYRSLLDESSAPIGVQQKLMRHSNVATTMNVYGKANLRAKQQANSKVVQMVLAQERPKLSHKQKQVNRMWGFVGLDDSGCSLSC